MAGGLAQAQPSSAGWAIMGSQAEIALNSGWIFDQRESGVGTFLTNASPTSSGLTFLSTGDATGLYVIGRAVRVIQAAGTVIATVGQSSFAAGVTTVYLNQFSTQSGLSTVATTGVITSVAASPLVVGATGGAVFSGGYTVTPTTGTGSLFAYSAGAAIALGLNPATVGDIRLGNSRGIIFRNALNTADKDLIYADASDVITIGTVGTNAAISGALKLGATPASSGGLRLTYSATAVVGRTSTGGDDVIWPHQTASGTLSTDTSVALAGTYTTLVTLTLGAGTWRVEAGVTLGSTGAAPGPANVKILDNGATIPSGNLATVFFSSANIVGASTVLACSAALSAIITNTTGFTVGLNVVGSTQIKAYAFIPQSTAGSGPATYMNAVKIG